MKKIFAFLAFGALCMSANAAYLYWQVDQRDYDNIANYSDVNAAALIAKNGSNIYAISYAADGVNNIGQTQGPVNISDYSSGYSFYVELYNYNNGSYSVLGQSETWSYNQLQNANFLYDEPLSVSQVSVWHGVAVNHESGGGGGTGGGGGYNAPEPTSAMLLLIGLAGLSLKRKQI